MIDDRLSIKWGARLACAPSPGTLTAGVCSPRLFRCPTKRLWWDSHVRPLDEPSADALVSELQDAGVDDAGLIVGIDFTRSNEW